MSDDERKSHVEAMRAEALKAAVKVGTGWQIKDIIALAQVFYDYIETGRVPAEPRR